MGAEVKVTGVTGDEPKVEKVEFVSDDKKSAKASVCVQAPKREVKCVTLDADILKACENGEELNLEDFGLEPVKKIEVSAKASVKFEHKLEAPKPVVMKFDEIPEELKDAVKC